MKSVKYITTVLATSLLSGFGSYAQDYSENIFEGHADVGSCALKGDLQFVSQTREYILTGSGDNIWFGEDQFHFAWKKMRGDFILTADVSFIGEGSHEHRKAGWMIRQTLDTDSPHVSGTVHGDGLTSLQYRSGKGTETSERRSPLAAPDARADDHPFYKHVYIRNIRIITISGAETGRQDFSVMRPEAIAYLYGGQGTINVQSWAPDGIEITFVSNSGPAE